VAENRTGKRFPLQLPIRVHKAPGGEHNVTIQGRGRVVRTDTPPPGHNGDANYRGVACVIDSYEFVRNT
jgi:hypothetical protein